ncbi:MAG: Na+/H+ antiporter NhaC [Xanthomonadales bacterium]|jgi:NhaC family Na+:H+ antiporter|nr:Na+/H+ antiporter NhaC [Xanthomonadales bacterium]
MTEKDLKRPIPLWLALAPLVMLIAMLSASVILFHDNAGYGPNQVALMLAAGTAAVIGLYLGFSWHDMEEAMVKGIGMALKACLILLAVGSLIGSWMLAGTAPTIIYYGLGILDPSWFYAATLLICAVVAISIGSSWTTASTIGLALVGIAQIMELSLPVTAGAVISGAYFGDKMSPLSDTTNLSPAMVGVDLFEHIRHMAWTTGPAFLIALVLFTAIGWNGGGADVQSGSIEEALALLDANYNITWPALLPLILLLVMAMRKIPALPTIALGAVAGCVVAVIWQPTLVQSFGAGDEGFEGGVATVRAMFVVLANGFVIETGSESLDSLLSRGGSASMLNTVWLVICAMSFGGVMEHTGLLRRIVDALLKGVRGTASLITTTVLTCIGMNIITAEQYMSIVLPGRMYRVEFARRGLAAKNLSRTLEDAGTMTSALVPWNTCGAFMAATLGVPTLAYAPFAFVNLLSPVIAIIYGIINFKIVPLEEAEAKPA